MADETILSTEALAAAKILTGAGSEEEAILQMLCAAWIQEWENRLREDVTADDCQEALICAAALCAAAGLIAGRSGDPVSGFTAGAVSVSRRSGAEVSAAANVLTEQAERLMAPWTGTADFSFRGVRG